MSNRGARAAVDGAMSEKEWQAQVVAFAEASGWTVWHDNDARRNDSGLPDLILIRERVVWAELKREGRYLTPTQRWFRDVLIEAKAEAYIWRPRDWSEVQRILGREGN